VIEGLGEHPHLGDGRGVGVGAGGEVAGVDGGGRAGQASQRGRCPGGDDVAEQEGGAERQHGRDQEGPLHIVLGVFDRRQMLGAAFPCSARRRAPLFGLFAHDHRRQVVHLVANRDEEDGADRQHDRPDREGEPPT
jgi:hypothetical protein